MTARERAMHGNIGWVALRVIGITVSAVFLAVAFVAFVAVSVAR